MVFINTFCHINEFDTLTRTAHLRSVYQEVMVMTLLTRASLMAPTTAAIDVV